MEHVNDIFHKIGKVFGLTDDPWGGRTAEINIRLARLMNREVENESPAEEYERIKREAKSKTGVR